MRNHRIYPQTTYMDSSSPYLSICSGNLTINPKSYIPRPLIPAPQDLNVNPDGNREFLSPQTTIPHQKNL